MSGADKDMTIDLFRQLLRRGAEAADPLIPIPRRVVLVNAGLAAGGAERQVVNTLVGLRAEGIDALFFGEYLHAAPGLDFYEQHLVDASVPVAQIERRIVLADCGFTSVASDVAELLEQVPHHLIEEILNLVEEFLQSRPQVVHSWQDSTSIKVGIAAVLAGVPRIILSSRNVNPTHFAYHQPYMRPAYQALAELPQVHLVNNSRAGVASYCEWLGLAPSRYTVIRNGVDLTHVTAPPPEQAAAFRDRMNIPRTAVVIGSIFRFWPEKRPLLWVETASLVARHCPTAHFLLVGDGPMREEIIQSSKLQGMHGRLHLIGESRDIAAPLSAMDVFLLTSQFEGTPNVVLEAQHLGLPIISTDAGGTREAIKEGVTGWIEQAEAQALAVAVLRVAGDGNLRRTSKDGGPAFVAERFGFDRMISETLSIYGLESKLRVAP
jgi:glycosyltransferase involved in cell wall biosynthesis